MNDLMMSSTWAEYADKLKLKSREVMSPFYANLEITPRCNFNCKMCYVHLTDAEAKRIGKEHSAEEWISMAKQLVEAGALKLLLTGGEVFVRKDFREIYEAISEMGVLIHIFTNGFFVDEKVLTWLAKRPPFSLRITLYGASNETYEKVTGIKNAFDQVIKNIDLIINSGIKLTLAATIISDNRADVEDMVQLATQRNLQIIVTESIVKPVRGAHSEAEFVRRNPGEVLSEMYEDEKLTFEFGILPGPFDRCNSRNCASWITWDGKMTICSFISDLYTLPFETGFETAWIDLQEQIKRVKKPEKCDGCKYAHFCIACPGIMASETGHVDQTNDYLCNIAKTTYEKHAL